MSHTSLQIWVNKQDLHDVTVMQDSLSDDVLGDNDVLIKTEQFGLSANNITYAAHGHDMGYWDIFPAGEGYGIVPVWGFATVVASHHPDIQPGERIFGFLPMASHWVIRAGKVTPRGLVDVHPDRNSIHHLYDSYQRCNADPAYKPDREVWQQAFRPLFITSFVLDAHVSEISDHGAILLSSASSKTASGTACLLRHQRKLRNADYRLIGLTSADNADQVASSNCYDEVVVYDEVDTLPQADSYWLLDFTGNGETLARLQRHLDLSMDTITLVGTTAWQARQKTNSASLAADVFFAPAHIKQCQQEWGMEQFFSRYQEAWELFCQTTSQTYYEKQYQGVKEAIAVYKEMLAGMTDPSALVSVRF